MPPNIIRVKNSQPRRTKVKKPIKEIHIYPQLPESGQRAKDLCADQSKVFVSFNETSLCYKNVMVMEDISLEVFGGEVLTLVGPSGSGKTTLLKALAGLEPVCKGVIAIGNKIVSQPGRTVSSAKRRIAMVFQDHALFPHLNVIENVLFPLKNGTSRVKITATKEMEIDEVLQELELSTLLKVYPHQLSGGQRQRVSLARALLASPQLLLLDEPFASQDPELQVQLQLTVQRIIWRLGITTIMVTHNQNEALSMGDRIGVMCNGKLLQVGKPQNVYHSPQTAFVAKFIGHGSFIPAKIIGNMLHCQLGSFSRFRWANEASKTKGKVQLFLRPDDVAISSGGNVRAIVEKKIFLGASNIYYLKIARDVVVMAIMPSRYHYEDGEKVFLSINLSNALVFTNNKKG